MKKQLKNKMVKPRPLLSLSPLRTCLLIVATFSLAACSGSGGNDAAPPNTNTPGILDDSEIPEAVAPKANFTNRLTSIPLGQLAEFPVQFEDKSENGSEAITNWLWQFGDGQTSQEPSPEHTYKSTGPFAVSAGPIEVTLTVSNSIGMHEVVVPASVTIEADIIVVDPSLPFSSTYAGTVPEYSERKLVEGEDLKLEHFSPIVDRMKVNEWRVIERANEPSSLQVIGDGVRCEDGKLYRFKAFAPSGNLSPVKTAWRDDIPTGAYTGAYYDRHHNVEGVKTRQELPGELVLLGLDKDTKKSRNVTTTWDRGTNILGLQSVSPRWASCRNDTEIVSAFVRRDIARYTLSYPEQIRTEPVMRHYKAWKKMSNSEVRLGLSGLVTREIETQTGIEVSEAESFERSLSATFEAKLGPFGASVTGSVAEAYSSSVTLVTYNSDKLTTTVDSSEKPEYYLYYSKWEEVDIFRIEGAKVGEFWSDPGYELSDKNVFELQIPTGVTVPQRVWYSTR